MTDLPAKLTRVLILTGVIAALGLPLMFLMENFVRDAIVTPLAYVVWLVGVVLDAMPQSYLLAALLGVAVYIAVRSLARNPPPPKPEQFAPAPAEGQASAWYRRLTLTTRGGYSQRRVKQQIGHLILDIIAHEQRVSARAAARAIEAGDVEVPDHIVPFVEAAFTQRLPAAPSLWHRILTFLQGLVAPRSAGIEATIDLDPALRYIEDRLRSPQPEETDGANPDA